MRSGKNSKKPGNREKRKPPAEPLKAQNGKVLNRRDRSARKWEARAMAMNAASTG